MKVSFSIHNFKIEYQKQPLIDGNNVRLTYELKAEGASVCQSAYEVTVGDFTTGRVEAPRSACISLELPLKPYGIYEAKLTVWDESGVFARAVCPFQTARMDRHWSPDWITDLRIKAPKKKSPKPLLLRKHFSVSGEVNRILLTSTAVGNYFMLCNGERVGNDLLAPGYTSYQYVMQYQVYDITEHIKKNISAKQELLVFVSGGWAVGEFGASHNSGAYGERQLFAAEIRIEYLDGRVETIPTDATWEAADDGPYTLAGIYEGADYDARRTLWTRHWRPADPAGWKYHPQMSVTYGALPRMIETRAPIEIRSSKNGGIIYDFGQNCAAVISIGVREAQEGQQIVIRHGELLDDGELMTANLSKARAEIHYICKKGSQKFTPELTYMGFRYARIDGIAESQVCVRMQVISSVSKTSGSFQCSDDRINRLQQNIMWSGISNFVDIPTDCPQRDERMGWTGDIAMFASTACFNFDMHNFLEKWLLDVNFEQGKHGEVGAIVPAGKSIGTGGCSAGWSDCAILVPWALYEKYGDAQLLHRQYPVMKKLLEAKKRNANILRFGRKKFIGRSTTELGDWLCPNGKMGQWGQAGVPIASVFFYNACKMTGRAALMFGEQAYARACDRLAEQVETAFRKEFTDGEGRLTKERQSVYAIAIYFGMLSEEERTRMGGHLARMVRENGYKIGTGFLGTPYILFALSDTGHLAEAYGMLLQEECPGWLYAPKVGATTVWECWNGVLPNGKINLHTDRPKFFKKPPAGGYDPGDRSLPGLSSLNHYAYGAVGDWLYRRLAGLEPTQPGYRSFRVAPLPGGGISWVRCETQCAYGTIRVFWELVLEKIRLTVEVPVGCCCEVVMPDGYRKNLDSGTHTIERRR